MTVYHHYIYCDLIHNEDATNQNKFYLRVSFDPNNKHCLFPLTISTSWFLEKGDGVRSLWGIEVKFYT
jgi:hypothetical protein